MIEDVTQADWKNVIRVIEPVLMLGPTSFLTDLQRNFGNAGIRDAVRYWDTAAIFDWIMAAVPFQGISDEIAFAYADRHGTASREDVESSMNEAPECWRLRSYWDFSGCGYSKGRKTCSEVELLPRCPVPALPLRKGSLNQAAFSFWLFVRDVCDGDLVSWIDARLSFADVDPEARDRPARMRKALLDPLTNVFGIGPKLWSMILADFLLGADPERERWTTMGASMVAVDTLVHNFLHRTGILHRFRAEHAYGSACYGSLGCAEILDRLATEIDVSEYESSFPAYFPRWIQLAIWLYCAELGANICNGRQIDDSAQCRNACCPVFDDCARIPLRAERAGKATDA